MKTIPMMNFLFFFFFLTFSIKSFFSLFTYNFFLFHFTSLLLFFSFYFACNIIVLESAIRNISALCESWAK
jgi:hypothetical protein